jgi:hypothetical protein
VDSIRSNEHIVFFSLDKSEEGRYCPFTFEQHANNNTYFQLNRSSGRLYHRCYDPDCHGHDPKEIPYHDRKRETRLKWQTAYDEAGGGEVGDEAVRDLMSEEICFVRGAKGFIDKEVG